MLDQNYNCLNLLVSSDKDDKKIMEILSKVIKQWYIFGQLASIFAVALKKSQLQEKYLNNNLNMMSKAKECKKIVEQNYAYSELMLKYNELLEVVKIYPFKDKFIKISNSENGKKQLRKIISNLKNIICKINDRTKQLENLIDQKQKIIISKYEAKREKRRSIHSGSSLLIAVIALVVSIIGQWKNIEPLIHNIIVYFKKYKSICEVLVKSFYLIKSTIKRCSIKKKKVSLIEYELRPKSETLLGLLLCLNLIKNKK